MTKVIQLILTQERRWLWKDNDPVRLVSQLYTLEWVLVCQEETEYDSWFTNFEHIKQ